MTPHYWDDAKKHLSKRDKALKKIIASYEGETLTLKGDPFFTLARSIIGQQISVKAADSVWRKLETGVGEITPRIIDKTPVETLRACGLSASKVTYLHALAAHFLVHKSTIKRWPDMDDAEIAKELTSIKGIGQWTAEMFLIFHLGRPDVFPVADLGLQKAVFRHYQKELRSSATQAAPRNAASPRLRSSAPLTKGEIIALAERWKPYRSVATWYLWRSLDPMPVEY